MYWKDVVVYQRSKSYFLVNESSPKAFDIAAATSIFAGE